MLPESSYVGPLGWSSVDDPANRPGTDIVFVGHAYTPGQRRLTEMAMHIEVGVVRLRAIDAY